MEKSKEMNLSQCRPVHASKLRRMFGFVDDCLAKYTPSFPFGFQFVSFAGSLMALALLPLVFAPTVKAQQVETTLPLSQRLEHMTFGIGW